MTQLIIQVPESRNSIDVFLGVYYTYRVLKQNFHTFNIQAKLDNFTIIGQLGVKIQEFWKLLQTKKHVNFVFAPCRKTLGLVNTIMRSLEISRG